LPIGLIQQFDLSSLVTAKPIDQPPPALENLKQRFLGMERLTLLLVLGMAAALARPAQRNPAALT
jgi:hypothetical protein